MKNPLALFSISVLVLFFGTSIYGQSTNLPINEETGLICYKEVVEETGNKEKFFNRAIAWINEYYTNPVNVTKTRDPESGLIKGLHRIKIKNVDEEGNETDAGIVQYKFTLGLKEGRYRYILTEFSLKRGSKIPVETWLNKDDPQHNPNWDSYLSQIDAFAESWIKSLKDGMKPPVEKKVDDW